MVEYKTAGDVADDFADAKSNLKKDIVMASADLKRDLTKVGQDLLSFTRQGAGKIALTGSNMMNSTVTLVKNPQFQTVTVSTASGAVAIGTAGGAFGCVTGVVMGAGAGLIPALFTFGLSIPVGSAIGGGVGTVAGTMLGATTGGAAGGSTGYAVYRFRAEIHNGALYVTTSIQKGAICVKDAGVKVGQTVNGVAQGSKERALQVHTKACDAAIASKRRAGNTVTTVAIFSHDASSALWTNIVDTTLRQLLMGSKRRAGNAVDTVMVCSQKTSSAVVATVMDPECEKVACCAVGGTMVGATTGGAGGALTGAALGTALGTVPAIFTFGLSIPVGGLMGGGIGMTVGCTAGGTTGCIIGGMSFAYRKQIYSKALCTYDGALNSRVAASLTFAKDSLMTLLLDTTLHDIGMGAQRRVGEAASATCESTKKTGSAMKAVVLDPEYEKTAGCAVGGALVFGTAGGAAATCAGAAMGAAVGVLPALFTFGLSIPVGAVVGGGMGMTIGGAAGGTAGLAAGGASYAYRNEIASSVKNLYSSAYNSVSSVKSRAQALVGSTGEPEGLVGSTGETESSEVSEPEW